MYEAEKKRRLVTLLSDVIKDCVNAITQDRLEEIEERVDELHEWIADEIDQYKAYGNKYTSPDVPGDYDTIVHFLFKNAPEYLRTLEDVDNVFHGTTKLGYKMVAYCKNLNYVPIKVGIPEEFRHKATEVKEINAYPVSALEHGLLNMLE